MNVLEIEKKFLYIHHSFLPLPFYPLFICLRRFTTYPQKEGLDLSIEKGEGLYITKRLWGSTQLEVFNGLSPPHRVPTIYRLLSSTMTHLTQSHVLRP